VSHEAEEVLCDKLKNNRFSLQIDESSDFSNKSETVRLSALCPGRSLPPGRFLKLLYNHFYAVVPWDLKIISSVSPRLRKAALY
jgi:hypothetical protein